LALRIVTCQEAGNNSIIRFYKEKMKQIKKLAVIGGTGKAGKYVVSQLLSQGINFTILLRNPENFQISGPLVEVVKGDARDYASVRSLIVGCEAVISTLGQPKGEPTIFSQATKNVIQAMTENNIRRYVMATGLSVDTPFDNKNPKVKFATDWMKTNYPETTTDKQLEYAILANSKIDWTMVRLPLISLTDQRVDVKVSLEDCPGEQISAADLADFLVSQLFEDTYERKAPFIANG
jgi:putative NADH-flavin reductase